MAHSTPGTSDIGQALDAIGAQASGDPVRPLADVAATGTVAHEICRRAGTFDVIITWDNPVDAVFAYAIAVAGDAAVVSATLEEGILSLSRRLEKNGTVLVFSSAFESANEITALMSLVEHSDSQVAAICAVQPTDALDRTAAGAVPAFALSS